MDNDLKAAENATGKYYVTTRCIGCNLCTVIASANFVGHETITIEYGYSYVVKQPENDTEEALCAEALYHCPADAIGNDG